jgi:hypothetical protein
MRPAQDYGGVVETSNFDEWIESAAAECGT